MSYHEYYKTAKDNQDEGNSPLPNGCTLYWKKNQKEDVYFSDENGIETWNTTL